MAAYTRRPGLAADVARIHSLRRKVRPGNHTTDPFERLPLDSPIRSPYLCNRKNDALFVVGTDTQIIPLEVT
jgi:hypothetical protein